MEINVKKDRKEINTIIENCLPLMIKNKRFTQECADAILVHFIENTPTKPKQKIIRNIKTKSGRKYKFETEIDPNIKIVSQND